MKRLSIWIFYETNIGNMFVEFLRVMFMISFYPLCARGGLSLIF